MVDALHEHDSCPPRVRRLWTDSAPEFRAAARHIRQQRPFAHYSSTPHRPQANGRAERFNRLAIEGTRATLMACGMPDRWWPLAIQQWAACFNASVA